MLENLFPNVAQPADSAGYHRKALSLLYLMENNMERFEPSPEERPLGMIVKIIALGKNGVGKSSLLIRHTHDSFVPHMPLSSIGVDFHITHWRPIHPDRNELFANISHFRGQIWVRQS